VSASSDISTCIFLGPSQHPFLRHRQGDWWLQGNEALKAPGKLTDRATRNGRQLKTVKYIYSFRNIEK